MNNTNMNTESDEANRPSTSGVASFSNEARHSLQTNLTDPLKSILRKKAQAVSKYQFLRHCAACSTIPKGLQLNAPLNIEEPSRNLKEKWVEVQRECNNKLLNSLLDHHRGQIHSNEELAQETIIKLRWAKSYYQNLLLTFQTLQLSSRNLVADASFTGKTFKPRKRKLNSTNENFKET